MKDEGSKRLSLGVLVSGRGTNLQAILDRCEEGVLSAEVKVVISNRPGVMAVSYTHLDVYKRQGLFIAFIGVKNAGIITSDAATILTRGDLSLRGPALALIGLMITAILMARNVRGAILIGIFVTTLIGIPMGVTHIEGSIIGKPESIAPIFGKMDIKGALDLGFMTIFSFWFVDVFDTVGTLMGTAARANMLDEKGQLPRIRQMMTVDAIGTCLGALLGTSTVDVYKRQLLG